MRRVVTLMSAILLFGCSTTGPQINVDTTPPPLCSDEPKADAITMLEVEWTVVELGGMTWISTTPPGYEALAENTQSMLKHLRQKNAIIRYYRDCVKDATAPIDNQ
jgi:hypothetical protein